MTTLTAQLAAKAEANIGHIQALAQHSAKTWGRTPEQEEAWVFGGGSGIPDALPAFTSHPLTRDEAVRIYMDAFRAAS